MKKQTNSSQHIAWNTHVLLYILMSFMFAALSISCFMWNEIVSGIVFVLFVLLDVFVFLISPQVVIFTDELVEIVYCFHQRLSIRWCDVRNIYAVGSWVAKGGGLPRYVIAYPEKEKRSFFVKAEIPKTRRTSRFLNRFYRKKID